MQGAEFTEVKPTDWPWTVSVLQKGRGLVKSPGVGAERWLVVKSILFLKGPKFGSQHPTSSNSQAPETPARGEPNASGFPALTCTYRDTHRHRVKNKLVNWKKSLGFGLPLSPH